MLLEIHMLKNYPPVNLNRDDSGAPKSCFFGGVQRGRISSQCLKRSWRTSAMFQSLGSSGIRTRHMPELVAEKLRAWGVDESFIDEAKTKLTAIANKEGKASDKGITTQIIFYADSEIERVAQRMKAMIEEDGSVKAFKKRNPKELDTLLEDAKVNPVTVDIALFGRMVTSKYFADVDASMQVAHAISTHLVNRESDYFTAVDDLIRDRDEDQDASGAGMLGDIDYNSCCYYEYASLDTDALRQNLRNAANCDELIEELLPVLLRAMAMSNPSGKQNTFAGHVFPDFVMLECKKDKIPLSYVNAFEKPVDAWGENPQIVANSIRKLLRHINRMDDAYELPILHRVCFAQDFEERHLLAQGEWMDKFAQLGEACVQWMREVDHV